MKPTTKYGGRSRVFLMTRLDPASTIVEPSTTSHGTPAVTWDVTISTNANETYENATLGCNRQSSIFPRYHVKRVHHSVMRALALVQHEIIGRKRLVFCLCAVSDSVDKLVTKGSNPRDLRFNLARRGTTSGHVCGVCGEA